MLISLRIPEGVVPEAQRLLEEIRCLYIISILMSSLIRKIHGQFVFFKLLSYCFKETIGFDVEALFTSRPASRLIS